ncbi:MAG: hypothetical protein HQL77_15350 [Magnetococcales bacterium]|nr:hypothetical protein [Magnetococcales bacterium]
MKKTISGIIGVVCALGISAVASANCQAHMDCGHCAKDSLTVRRTISEAENKKVIWPKNVEVRGQVQVQEFTPVAKHGHGHHHGKGAISSDMFVVTTGYPAGIHSDF